MWRAIVATSIVLALWLAAVCGQPALSPEQAATATAVSKLATFDALPPAVKDATQTAVMATIAKGLNP